LSTALRLHPVPALIAVDRQNLKSAVLDAESAEAATGSSVSARGKRDAVEVRGQ
jgi:hypothetical protein